MAYQSAGRGTPRNYVTGPNPYVNQPFCHDAPQNDCSSSVETASQPVPLFHFLNCRGADSMQNLQQPVHVHMIEVVRVWFNIPPGATLPSDNTLWLTMSLADKAGKTTIYTARTQTDYNVPATPVEHNENDPTQESNSLYPGTVLVVPLGNVLPGDNVLAKNKGRVQLEFPGAARGSTKVRVTLCTSDGEPYLDLGDERVFVEMYVYGERHA